MNIRSLSRTISSQFPPELHAFAYTAPWLARIRRYEFATANEIAAYQLRTLNQVLALAWEIPLYADNFSSAGLHPGPLKSLDELKAYPCITREGLNELYEYLNAKYRGKYTAYSSSGFTGTPVRVLEKRFRRHGIEQAFLASLLSRVGYQPYRRQRFVVFKITGPDSSVLMRQSGNRLEINHQRINQDTLKEIRSRVEAFSPHFFHGYPSTLSRFARLVASQGTRMVLPRLRATLLSSEVLTDSDRRIVEETFGARVISLYGHSEHAVFAGECEHSHELHIEPLYCVVNLESTTPRTVGQEIIATSLIAQKMPIIRYRTGDFGSFAEGPCTCGRTYTRLRNLDGRKPEQMRLADGSRLPFIFGEFQFSSNLIAFQLVQLKPGQLVVRVERTAEYNRENELQLKTYLENKLLGIKIASFDYVTPILMTRAGKRILFLDYCDQDH